VATTRKRKSAGGTARKSGAAPKTGTARKTGVGRKTGAVPRKTRVAAGEAKAVRQSRPGRPDGRPARGAAPDPTSRAVPTRGSAGADPVADGRRRLDDLDRRLMDLVVERAAEVRTMSRLKRSLGIDIVDVSRETEIVEALRERAAGRLPEDELDNFIDALRELMQGVALEREH
jgi:chorismate mutase